MCRFISPVDYVTAPAAAVVVDKMMAKAKRTIDAIGC